MTIRVFVLIAAVACLGLAMCAYTERAKPAETQPANPPAQQAKPQQQTQQPQKPKPEDKPRYFPATKAPGSFR